MAKFVFNIVDIRWAMYDFNVILYAGDDFRLHSTSRNVLHNTRFVDREFTHVFAIDTGPVHSRMAFPCSSVESHPASIDQYGCAD